MQISFDFGGSTVDAVFWDGDEIKETRSFESQEVPIADLDSFVQTANIDLQDVTEIFVTGGKSRFFQDKINDTTVTKIPEIDAIGHGGFYITNEDSILVVSMGTGTCIVSMEGQVCKHIGGTGVGGGTFLGLARELLSLNSIDEALQMASSGETKGVDISVEEIVGGGVGRVPGEATASNLGKLAREVEFKKEDLAAGIINLIGQTIGAAAAFAAQSESIDKVVLVGKLTRAEAIIDVIKGVAADYGVEIFLPKNSQIAPAIGAKVAGSQTLR